MPARLFRMALATLTLLCGGAGGQELAAPVEGFLCCNMLSDGSWISDINYRAQGKKMIPAGTRVKHTGYGRWRLLVEIDGKPLAIGND